MTNNTVINQATEDNTLDSPAISIRAALLPKLNLAFHQNAVPTIQELVIINNGESPLKELVLTLSSEPAFIKSVNWRIDFVDSGQHCHLTDLDAPLESTLFSRLTESETAQVTFVLSAQGEEVARLVLPIELLARNQWGGIEHMPEMVAAFVQPNELAVERLLKKAAGILRKHGKDCSLNGYEGGSKRAWELTSAIWSAAGSMGLVYSLPPASFEQTGQKIRSPEQITKAGIATCMDMALFLSAAIEQCGLNPLIVFTKGHVFMGVWLKKEEFTTVVVDDITALRKRQKLNDLVLFESTLVTQNPCPSFKRAIEVGAQFLSENKESEFELAIDIRRARLQRIKPLANDQKSQDSGERVELKEDLEPVFEEAPDLLDDKIIRQEEYEVTKVQSRLDRWQRKLLDLSLRNNLLNFRSTKRTIKLDAPNPAQIEDMLADGHTLKLLSSPDLMVGTDTRSQAIHEKRTNEDIHHAYALDALNRKELLVSLPKNEMDVRLVELYRFSRTLLQEGGANTLFLALGFLSWTRDSKDKKSHRAPLILIPITLNRRSLRSGFTLKLHDDEPRFNPTLIEMLRQDFKLELPFANGELPKDEHGLDIDGIWKAVSLAIKDIRGWEVVEDLVLSTFSFAKYLMWKDLVDRTEQLKQSPVVKHLLDTPRDVYPSQYDFPDPRTLDSTQEPDQVFCPLPVDSSQLSAVIAAVNGKDFVLIGPPGTGKSQTIANLIAQCLAEQKTVLFVSEKIAALNVVYRRLSEVGLGDFCLELHSNKARKLDVLENLRKAWDAKGEVDTDEWRKETGRLKVLRTQLNEFVEHLHRKRRNGLTAYTAIGRIVAGRDIVKLDLSWPSVDTHTSNDLFEIGQLVEDLDINAQQVGEIANSSLSLISYAKWSPSWTQSLIKSARELISRAKELHDSAANFLNAAGLPELPLDTIRRKGLALLSQVLPVAAGRDWRFALRPDARTICDGLHDGLQFIEKYQVAKNKLSIPWSVDTTQKVKEGLSLISNHRKIVSQLSAHYAENGASLDAKQLHADWIKAEKSWLPISSLRRKKIHSMLVAVAEDNANLELPEDIERLIKLRKLEEEISNLNDLTEKTSGLWSGLDTKHIIIIAALKFQSFLALVATGSQVREEQHELVSSGQCGIEMAADLSNIQVMLQLEKEITELDHLKIKTNGLWMGLRTNVKEVKIALNFQKALSESIASMATTAETLANIKTPLERLLGDGNSLLEATGPIPRTGNAYRQTLKPYHEATKSLASIAGTPFSKIKIATEDLPEILAKQCESIVQLEPKLRAWCAWRRVRDVAISHGLDPLVKAIETGEVAPGKAKEVFEANYARWWLNAIVDGDEVLRSFVSATHNKRIEDFKELDDRLTDLTRSYVRARLCANLPSQEDTTKNSEWGLLRREMQKKRRHLPLRKMINSIPTAITKLAPCVMMSPISIAQYLSTDTALFDVVVFDEASQIPVWDAIGAIARGKQVVMVGDPKQLPPTAFFDRAEADGDEDTDIESDLESILDECLGANLPTQNLSWHYRSRHESLIAFSNNRYYGGGLVTFPSPNTEDKAVKFHYIGDGVYEKGGARINKPEAFALVDHIVSRLKNPEFKKSGLTIGVVTFNSEQQRLIEDLLDNERRKSPALEGYFSEDIIEPIFVKNIESVQGDQRDIMYFSLTYGPDLTGAISMNFGPMNREGGERRLNVAITRACNELLVFSSLKPAQIDLSRTRALGVKDLKHFMEFAERGPKAIAEAVHGSVREDYDSPFEQAVAVALASKGWQVHPQVGVSSFRIDLGVVDPDAPGCYLAGVECDGATYHRSATARDRDKIREQVLRGLGWEILRIWSTDWWIDSAGALEKTHAALELLLQESRIRREEEKQRLDEANQLSEEALNANTTEGLEVLDDDVSGSSFTDHREPSIAYAGQITTERAEGGNSSFPKQIESHSEQTADVFRSDFSKRLASDSLFSPYQEYEGGNFNDPRVSGPWEIADKLRDIVDVEGPMLAKRAYDIYLRGCGIKRMGRDLKSIMNKSLQHAVKQGSIIAEDELSAGGLVHTFIRNEKTPPLVLRTRGSRAFDEIPPSEILAASYLAMENGFFEKASDEHLHAILKLFGLKRLTTATGARLLDILEMDFDYVLEWIDENRQSR